MAKSTVHRLLAELLQLDLVSRNGRYYCIGEGVRQLVAPREEEAQDRTLQRLIKPLLLLLHERTRYVVGLGVAAGASVRFVELLYEKEYSHLIGLLDQPTPLSNSAAGRALLAHTSQLRVRFPADGGADGQTTARFSPASLGLELAGIRRRGFSIDEHGTRLGITAVAVPLCGPDGQALAALSIGARPDAFEMAKAQKMLHHSKEEVRRILLRAFLSS